MSKFAAILLLSWVVFAWLSVILAMIAEPSDALPLLFGGVVLTLPPFLLGVYLIRRNRRARRALETKSPI